MVFTGVSMSETSIKLEEFTLIQCSNTGTSDAFVAAKSGNKFRCWPLTYLGSNNFELKFYGWMIGEASIVSLTIIGLNGDVDVSLASLEVLAPQEPILPLLQFMANWLESDAILSTYQKAVVYLKKNHHFLTDTPQFVVYTPSGDFTYPEIGDTKIEWDYMMIIDFTDDVRPTTDNKRHETFLKRVADYLRNNPQLDGTLGLVHAMPMSFELPEDEYEEKYLQTSQMVIGVELIPEYL